MPSRRAQVTAFLVWGGVCLINSHLTLSRAHAQSSAQPLDLSPARAANLALDPTTQGPPLPVSARTEFVEEEDPTLDVELPGLERRADGSYRFRGLNIHATISPQGQVKIRDVYVGVARRMQALPTPNKDGLTQPTDHLLRPPVTAPWLALQFKIDLLSYLEHKLGVDTRASEKRWFMERTRTLRERLEAKALRTSLHRTLLSIWSKPGMSFAARKDATFALWENANADDGARALVVDFVRERCPAESACAFTPRELAELNRGRPEGQHFLPYSNTADALDSPQTHDADHSQTEAQSP